MKILANITLVTALLLADPLYASNDKSFNAFLGSKELSSEDWGKESSQDSYGLMYAFKINENYNLWMDINLFLSQGTIIGETWIYQEPIYASETTELGIGIKKVFGDDVFQPYISAGIARFTASVENESSDSISEELGTWVSAGAAYRIGEMFNMGLHVRKSSATASVNNRNRVSIGGKHVGFFFGFQFQ